MEILYENLLQINWQMIVLAVLVVINLLVAALPTSLTRFDTTDQGMYTISATSEKFIKSVDRNVTIYVLSEGGTMSGTLQTFLDEYLKANGGEVDYIHGEDSLKALSARPDAVGFLFDGIAKSELFPYVEAYGALPRKTFSMGEAHDKRYYMECRKIR